MGKKHPEPPPNSDWLWTGSDMLSFDGHNLVIKKTAGSNKGTFTYAIEQISGVQISKPGVIALGSFRVLVAGEVAPRGRQPMMDVVKDPFAVQLRSSLMPAAERIAGKVRAAQAELRSPRPAAPAVAAAAGLGDQLAQLAALHAQGALTDAQFEAAKAQVLGVDPGPQDQSPAAW
jgi:Short C-terminal domain